MLDFILVHRKQNGNALDWGVPIWSTCLRQIAFLDPQQFENYKSQILATDEVLKDSPAFLFLLEVICGLQSPMLGETEVQGQFKSFFQQHLSFHNSLKNTCENLLALAKKIRAEHLQELGCHSYGSWIRKRLAVDVSVGIVGSGHLVSEILPWLKAKTDVKIYARDPQKAKNFVAVVPHVRVLDLASPMQVKDLVLAAPVSNAWVMETSQQLVPGAQVLDLRGETELSSQDIQDLKTRDLIYVSLRDIMSDVSENKNAMAQKILAAKSSVQKAVEILAQKSLLRPGGWEDLCG